MKTHLKHLIRTSLKGMALAALLVAGSVQTSQAGSSDPSAGGSFTWDLLSSGSGQRGIALITFNSDQTFRGYQLLAALPPKNVSPIGDGRGGNDNRGDTSSSNGKTNHFVYGFSPIDGVWTLDSKGQIVGFFIEAINVTSLVTNFADGNVPTNIVNSLTLETTNLLLHFNTNQSSLSTNFVWANPPGHSEQYTFANPNGIAAIGSAESTNTVSFTGKAAANKRLNLVCSTTFGKVTYKGIPAVPGLDLTGHWVGSQRVSGVQGNLLFSLTSAQASNPFPALYPDIANFPNIFFTTDGVGVGGAFTGVVIFSQHKNVGFRFRNDDGTLTAVIGTLKATKHGPSANTEGIQEPFNRIAFTATLQ